MNEDECGKIIEKEWGQGRTSSFYHLDREQTTLNQCSSALFRWNKSRRKVNEKAIKENYEVLRKLQEEEGSYDTEEIRKVEREIGNMLEEEYLKWRQRAKINWYHLGSTIQNFSMHVPLKEKEKPDQSNNI